MPTTQRSLVRDEIAAEFTWKLDDIFEGWDSWEAAFSQIESRIAEFEKLSGTLGAGPAELTAALELSTAIDQASERVYWYPALMADEDTRDNEIGARKQRVQLLLSRIRTASAWLSPEILSLGETKVRAWLDEDDGLALYRFHLEDLFRLQAHVLDEAGERILALSGPTGSTAREAHGALSNADMRLPKITLQSGEEIQLSHQRYYTILHSSRVQVDRAAAFHGLYGEFARTLNTYATLYQGVCQRDWFLARARGYESTLAAALDGHAIPTSVVTNLIDTSFAHAEPLRRYFRLRKRFSGLEEIHLYDGSFPLVDHDPAIPYEEACERVVRSVAQLGTRYQEQVRDGFASRWIDVYENEGKRNGAYSAPVYGVHPYMLMNYDDTLNDMFTLAHEMGHSMHTMLSHEHQPYVYAHYTIFVAEVASTLNEALLLDQLLLESEDAREKAALLQHAIDSIVGTFYTQVLFAAFELDAHRAVEADQALTAEKLDEIYFERLKALYEDAVVLDPEHAHTWARIPHFYRSPYYVYQYATCFASAAQLMQSLRDGGDAARQRYLRLLSSGGNAHPMDQLRAAGVDLAKPEVVAAVPQRLDQLLDQLESALDELETSA